MLKLSICMMVKNEESNLKRCLDSLENLRNTVDSELIIVDTGSEDKTIEIARQYTEKVYFHEWNNNFSEMRNKSTSYAKGRWILIIDADEVLTGDHGLVEFLKKNNLKYAGAAIRLSNVMDASGRVGPSLLTVRIFKNDGKSKYKGSIHNTPVIEGEVLEITGLILHYGYQADDKELMERKFERTSKLLLMELEKDPGNIYYRYQLGSSYDMHNDKELALITYERAYRDLCDSKEPFEKHIYLWGSLVKVLVSNQSYNRAVEIAEQGLKVDSDNIDLLYFGGIARLFLKQMEQGIIMLETYLEKMRVLETLVIYKNPALQLFTVNSQTECYYNLMQAYRQVGEWSKVLKYGWLIIESESEDSIFYENVINIIVQVAVEFKEYSHIITLYEKHKQSRWKNLDRIVCAEIQDLSIAFENEELFNQFVLIPSSLGAVIRLRVSQIRNESICVNDYLIGVVRSSLLNGCDEALYFGLSSKLKLGRIFIELDELNLMTMFSRLSEKYKNFFVIVEDYLNAGMSEELIYDKNVRRVLTKYLALSSFGSEKEVLCFDEYIGRGIEWVESIYTREFLETMQLNMLRNAEEQFLVAIWNLLKNMNVNSVEAVNSAVNCFSEWQTVLYRWLKFKFEATAQNSLDAEAVSLFKELLVQIEILKENGNVKAALDIVNDYLKIYPQDTRMLLLKSELVLKHIKS